MINGVNPATFLILPMLGEKHPDQYPRFRDCFVTEDGSIGVLTRVGGNNRNSGYGEEVLQSHPNYLYDEDEESDNTYAMYYFSVPDEWKDDFAKITNGKLLEISQAYKDRLYLVFPKLTEKFNNMFNSDNNKIEN